MCVCRFMCSLALLDGDLHSTRLTSPNLNSPTLCKSTKGQSHLQLFRWSCSALLLKLLRCSLECRDLRHGKLCADKQLITNYNYWHFLVKVCPIQFECLCSAAILVQGQASSRIVAFIYIDGRQGGLGPASGGGAIRFCWVELQEPICDEVCL